MEYLGTTIRLSTATVGGFFAYWLGGLDKLLTALLVLMVLDFVTGICRAVYMKKLSSEVGLRGIAKKVLALSVVVLAFAIESIIGMEFALREIVITFFIANEGISILENASATGLPVPDKIKEVLIQLSGKKSKEGKYE